jgi:phosphoglycolate phosphatase-like HAD superfamily hydrolase
MQGVLDNSLVLFNIGDTLIQAPKGIEESAFAEVFKKVFGVDASIHSIRYHGKTSQQIIFEVMKRQGGFEGRENEIRVRMEECKRVMCDYWNDNIKKNDIRLKPGIEKILSGLKKEGYLLGVVTGNFFDIAFSKLSYSGIANSFLLIISGEDGWDRKSLLETVIKSTNWGYVYYFGDTAHDMAAGCQVKGIIPVGVATGSYDVNQLKRAGAAYSLPDLTGANVLDFLGLKKRKAAIN